MLDLKQNIMLNQYHNKNTIEHSNGWEGSLRYLGYTVLRQEMT